MSDQLNRVRFTSSTTGTGSSIAYGSTYSNAFLSPTEAGAVDGRKYTYVIQQGDDFEIQQDQVWTATGATIARGTPTLSKIGGVVGTTKITLNGTQQVSFGPSAHDLTYPIMRSVRTVTGTTDTLVDGDCFGQVTYNSASAVAVSLAQAGASNAFVAGWNCFVRNTNTGAVTITPTTSTINGAATLVLQNSDAALIVSDGTNYTAIVWAVREVRYDQAQTLTAAQQAVALQNIGANQGALINGKIVAGTPSGGAITFSVKGLDGNDPSSTNPVLVIYSNGAQRAITSALSLTLSSGSTLGVTSSVGTRIWFTLHDDAGTQRLGARNCAATASIIGFPGNGRMPSSTEGGAGAADSAGITYTNTGVSGEKQFVIVAFAEWDSGMTAGTWTAPSQIQQWRTGMAKPGDVLQTTLGTTTSVTATTSSSYQDTNLSVAISPTHAANAVETSLFGGVYTSDSSTSYVAARVFRGLTGVSSEIAVQGASGAISSVVSATGLDFPNTTGSITYLAKVKNSDNATSVEFNHNLLDTRIVVKEIMT